MFSQHSLVYTVSGIWTTLKLMCQTSVDHIKAKCDLHFAFLDGGVIGILLCKCKEVNNKAPGVDTDANINLIENIISHETTDKNSDASQLKDCIIKLTDLSAKGRNKWLGFI